MLLIFIVVVVVVVVAINLMIINIICLVFIKALYLIKEQIHLSLQISHCV